MKLLDSNPKLHAWILANRQFEPNKLIKNMVDAGYTLAYAQTALIEATQMMPSVEAPKSAAVSRFNEASDRWVKMPELDSFKYNLKVLESSLSSNYLMDLKGNKYPIGFADYNAGILQVLNVLSDEQCNELINIAQPKLAPSTVIDENAKTKSGIKNEGRTSLGGFVSPGESSLVDTLDQRLAELFLFPVQNGEHLQVLNYKKNAEYRPHLDYFMASTTGGKSNLNGGGNRIATILVYLNDVPKGGGTGFPKHQISVRPVKGSALFFQYYCSERNAFDRDSLHSGEPVIEGEKWVATRWVRSTQFILK